ncbi:MAG: opioid growth factor receptor-related protein [Isosphaeraceae bacterium]|jgi:hypothetical protein
MSQLIEFYRGTGSDARGRNLEQIWAYSDNEMEYHHDFIQWLFPLREPSQYNPDAPVLSDEDIRIFRADALLRLNLVRSCERFLSFLGLARHEERIGPGLDFERKSGVFTSPNHNWLRITRVLTSLRLLGLEADGQAFFACLQDLVKNGQARVSIDTMAYWQNAAFPDRPTQR